MKKVLSIVLSIVMVLCMMPAMAFADTTDTFTDAADIEYVEAVDVASAVGIINGMPDGSFVPNGNVTREQAAKLIATLLLGDKAEKLATDVAPFSDVAADRWSAGYIAYCVEKGILAGVGDGKFDPTGNVTALQLAKMLLIVAGYDADIEGLTGDKWGVNTSVLAEENELFAGNEAVIVNNAATREEAALYILNALVADMVKYANKGTNITLPDGTKVVVGASAATKVTVASDPTINVAADGIQQVAEKYIAKLGLSASSDPANFGRPSNKWTYDGKVVGTYATKEPVLTYNTSVKEKDLFADLGVSGYAGSSAKYVIIDEVWADGVQVAKSSPAGSSADPNWCVPATGGTYKAEYNSTIAIAKGDTSTVVGSGEGVVTEIYKTSTPNHYTMVTVKEFFAQVTGVVKANDTNGAARKINLKVFGVANTSFETESFAKDDMVLVTMAGSDVKSVKLAEKVENVAVTAYDDTTVTFNGTAHKYSQFNQVATKTYTMTGGKTYTFYLDSCGNVIEAKDYNETSKAYVFAVSMSDSAQGDTVTGQYKNVKYVDMNGKTAVVKVASGATGLENKFYTIKADKDNADLTTFSAVASTSAGATTLSAVQPAVATGVVANNSTVFILQTKENEWKTYTGISSVPTYTTSTAVTCQAIIGDDGFADVIYLDVTYFDAGSTDASEVIYITSTKAAIQVDTVNDITYKVYKTIDGTVKTTTTISALGFNKIESYDSYGYINSVTTTGLAAQYNIIGSIDCKVDYSAPALVVPTKGSFSVASDATVYVVDSNATVTKKTVADLDDCTLKGTLSIVYKSNTDKTVVEIYLNGTVTE